MLKRFIVFLQVLVIFNLLVVTCIRAEVVGDFDGDGKTDVFIAVLRIE